MTALLNLLASIGVMCVAFTLVALLTIGLQDWRMRRAQRHFDAHVEQAARMASRRRHPSAIMRDELDADLAADIAAQKAKTRRHVDEWTP